MAAGAFMFLAAAPKADKAGLASTETSLSLPAGMALTDAIHGCGHDRKRRPCRDLWPIVRTDAYCLSSIEDTATAVFPFGCEPDIFGTWKSQVDLRSR